MFDIKTWRGQTPLAVSFFAGNLVFIASYPLLHAGTVPARGSASSRQLWVEAALAAIAFHVFKNLPILQFAILKIFRYCSLWGCLI